MPRGSGDHELSPERFVRKIVEDVLTDPNTLDWRYDIGLDDTTLEGMAERIERMTHKMSQNDAFLRLMEEIEQSGEIPEGRTAEASPDYEKANDSLKRRKEQLRNLIRAHLEL